MRMCKCLCVCVLEVGVRQMSDHSEILGSARETDPGVFAGAGALVQREPSDASKNGTHARTYTQSAAFPARNSQLGGKIW